MAARHTAAGDSNERDMDLLRKLQLVEYGLLCRFADICEEQGYRYFILGGTLLGAVRHGGFIPWDDDIDVGMPRPDYEEFLQYVADNPEILRRSDDTYKVGVVSLYSDKTYRQGMAKMTSDEIRVIDRCANIENIEDAWIDVIPIDGFPSGKIAGAIHKARLMFWKVMDATAQFDYTVNTKRDRGFVGGVAFKAFELFCRLVRPFGSDYHRVLMHTEAALKRYAYDESEITIDLLAASGFGEICRRDELGSGVDILFEDRYFKAPDDTPAVLNMIYGPDYMTPPPENDRNWHNLEVIDKE